MKTFTLACVAGIATSLGIKDASSKPDDVDVSGFRKFLTELSIGFDLQKSQQVRLHVAV